MTQSLAFSDDTLSADDEFDSAADAADAMPVNSSFEALEYQYRKARLRRAIDALVDAAPSWDGEPAFVSVEAAAAADRFIIALPPNRRLPLIAPEGEGGILFVWEPPEGNCIVTVEQNVLHLLDHPGTDSVQHVDAQPFVGWRIPLSILHRIPLR